MPRGHGAHAAYRRVDLKWGGSVCPTLHTSGMDRWRGTSGRKVARGGVLLCAAVALVGCASSFASVEEMQAIPGATSVYPGSVVYDSSAQPPERNVMADNPGQLQTVACTTASVQELAQWFDDQLEADGWRVAPGYQAYWTPPPSETGASARAARVPTRWERQDAELELTTLSEREMRWYKDKHPDAAAEAARAGCTVDYRTRLSMIAFHTDATPR